MRSTLQQLLVGILVLTQCALAALGGQTLHLGGGMPAESSGPPVCSRAAGPDHRSYPAPVEPHEDECPCVDVSAPEVVARPESGTVADDTASAAAPDLIVSVLLMPAPSRTFAVRAPARQHPPGLAIGLRTTRLLI